VMTEISALRGLATACEVSVESVALDDQPLRLIQRSWAAGRIAIADHGPPRATPVLIFHSNISGRHHPRSFISKLQAAGYRPIAVERAGYGLTDTVAGDPVDAGVRDVHDVLDALGLPTAIAIARCTTASVIACAAEHEGRITGGVLLWPDPPPREDRSVLRMSQRARSIFVRHHDLALPFVRMLCRRMSAGASEKLWRSAVKGVAVDEALLDDPAERADLLRGCQQAVRGMYGFLNEAIALGAGANPVQMKDGSRWSAIFGSGYEKFDVADAARFWGAAMPGGTVDIVREGVHFLHVTHTDAVIAALRRAG
jgi:pimeloyl-ACP methyl ester carboxylesterase